MTRWSRYHPSCSRRAFLRGSRGRGAMTSVVMVPSPSRSPSEGCSSPSRVPPVGASAGVLAEGPSSGASSAGTSSPGSGSSPGSSSSDCRQRAPPKDCQPWRQAQRPGRGRLCRRTSGTPVRSHRNLHDWRGFSGSSSAPRTSVACGCSSTIRRHPCQYRMIGGFWGGWRFQGRSRRRVRQRMVSHTYPYDTHFRHRSRAAVRAIWGTNRACGEGS